MLVNGVISRRLRMHKVVAIWKALRCALPQHAGLAAGKLGHVFQRRVENVESELTARQQMLTGSTETGELIVPREVVQKRAEGNDDESEALVEAECAHVVLDAGDKRLNILGACRRLVPKPAKHSGIPIQSNDANTSLGNGNRYSARSCAKLEHWAAGFLSFPAVPFDIAPHAAWVHLFVKVYVVVCDGVILAQLKLRPTAAKGSGQTRSG